MDKTPQIDTDVILHCFNMTYTEVDKYLTDLETPQLFTHIQLPPVQPHRIFKQSDEIITKKAEVLLYDIGKDIQQMVTLMKKGKDIEHLYFFQQHISYFLNTPLLQNLMTDIYKEYLADNEEIVKICDTISNDLSTNIDTLLTRLYGIDYPTFLKKYTQQLVDYPPWFAIYQPKSFTVGDTMYGSTKELQSLIKNKKYNYHFTADAVLNHLQGTKYEWQAWEAVLKGCKKGKSPITIADCVQSTADPTVIGLLSEVIGEGLHTSDLSTINPPYYCNEAEEKTRCWLSQALPQVNQNHPLVIKKQNEYLQQISDIGFDSLRLDAAGHMPPEACLRIIKTFQPYYAYAEAFDEHYAHLMPTIDLKIGSFLINKVFRYGGNVKLLTKIEPPNRVDNLHCVVAIVTHDTMSGSFGTPIHYNTTLTDYSLAMAYLCQRVYGIPLLLPFDLQSPIIKQGLLVRQKNKEYNIVSEYNLVRRGVFISEKKNAAGEIKLVCFINNTGKEVSISTFNLKNTPFTVPARMCTYIEIPEIVTYIDYEAEGGRTRKHKLKFKIKNKQIRKTKRRKL